MAGFTAGLAGSIIRKMDAGVRTGRKYPGNGRMTVGTSFVTDVLRPGDFRRDKSRSRDG